MFDKVKGAFRIGDVKKIRHDGLRPRGLTSSVLSPARSLSGSPMRNMHGGRAMINDMKSGRAIQPKQAILTDDEILAKLMLKISSIEEKVYRIDKQVKS